MLTVEKKLNAEKELEDNIKKISELRKRNSVLKNYIRHAKKSKYKGMHNATSMCYAMFRKKYKELTKAERKLYNQELYKRKMKNQ